MQNIQLGFNFQQVKEVLAEPLKITQESGLTVYWYKTTLPTDADFVYFENNVVIMKSTFNLDRSIKAKDFISKLGAPTNSYVKVSQNREDSFLTTEHVWLNNGLAITAQGSSNEGIVQRIKEFNPKSFKILLENNLLNFREYKRISSTEYVPASIAATPVGVEPSILLLRAEVILGIFFGTLLCLGIFLMIRKANKRQ